MSWYITAQIGMDSNELNRKLKSIIRDNSFFLKMFDEYDIPIERIDDQLTFKIKKMHGIHAQGNGRYIFLNPKLFERGDFLEEKIHFVAHELTHWLTKQREEDCYFADPEEIAAFTHGIIYELLRGKSKQEIFHVLFPIIEAHFEQKQDAKQVFLLLFNKALKKSEKYNELV